MGISARMLACTGLGTPALKCNFIEITMSIFIQDGYWKNKKKCEKCNCNEYGSKPNINCDPINGRCICKSGVTGFLCDTCLTGYYGTVETDCKSKYTIVSFVYSVYPFANMAIM